ncbi:MAG: ATP-binding cassette domain-containing protein [Xanthomonadales bacterium]|nr:ATP-binding cassette domain-containing protein [Xanthomonadales bacterium]NIN60021.1 ATP-binding cassette domain-containing protein [Xanthomonadales bacterium]NIN75389.1 ATP-binding cassette domain-containing protein [Xanthomonadales bacterium]NIO14212.1 ATP-binding cassette domain-containing protein [Xanthomonadales bacterium]NIP12414.1 ATP-binding cassette domain-containing protein [Xanthomonadales bacterium]
MNTTGPLLQVQHLSYRFPAQHGVFRGQGPGLAAVERVSFAIAPGQVFGLVGESGSGKSTLARCLLRLLRPQAGRVLFAGRDLLAAGPAELRQARRRMQVVFQDPMTALSPRRTIGQSLHEPLQQFRLGSPREREDRIVAGLAEVGLDAGVLNRYPHQLSSGQRQRVCIARALLPGPDLVVADEAVSALDVSVQAQVLKLVRELQRERGIAFLFISHDLAVIQQVADRVGVMYRGQLVETASRDDLFRQPLHPYTRALLAAVPDPDPSARRERPALPGQLSRKPATTGCAFESRCEQAMAVCRQEAPGDHPGNGNPQHRVKCHAYAPTAKPLAERRGQTRDSE